MKGFQSPNAQGPCCHSSALPSQSPSYDSSQGPTLPHSTRDQGGVQAQLWKGRRTPHREPPGLGLGVLSLEELWPQQQEAHPWAPPTPSSP